MEYLSEHKMLLQFKLYLWCYWLRKEQY